MPLIRIPIPDSEELGAEAILQLLQSHVDQFQAAADLLASERIRGGRVFLIEIQNVELAADCCSGRLTLSVTCHVNRGCQDISFDQSATDQMAFTIQNGQLVVTAPERQQRRSTADEF